MILNMEKMNLNYKYIKIIRIKNQLVKKYFNQVISHLSVKGIFMRRKFLVKTKANHHTKFISYNF